ncbi:MAG: MarR family winged helix-turn-helix transcriptional regulator [Oscillospiraceae bacterium]
MENRSVQEQLFFNFHKANHLMHRSLLQGMPKGGPGAAFGQERLLQIIMKKGEITQKELVEMLDARAGSLSELLSKLEKNGLITRTPSDDDRRSMNIAITESGKQAANEAAQEREKMAAGLFEVLSADEQAQLNELLAKLTAAWKEKTKDLPGGGHGCGHGGPHGGFHGGPHGGGGCHHGPGGHHHGGWHHGPGHHGHGEAPLEDEPQAEGEPQPE